MNLAPLPPHLDAAAVAIAAIASAVLAGLSQLGLGTVPGFRAQDGSRNAAMRVLLGVLNLAGLLAYAWTQGIVLVPAQVPMLLGVCVIAAGGGHYFYGWVKAGSQASGSGTPAAPAPVAVLPPAVPPLPTDATPVPSTPASAL